MKKLIFGLAIVAGTFFAACKKDVPDSVAPTPPPVEPMATTAKLSGTERKFTSLKGTVIKSTTLDNKILSLSGIMGNRRVGLTITEAFDGSCFDLKKYDYMGINNQAFFTYDSIMISANKVVTDTITGYLPISGSVTITDCNLSLKTLSGKFEFKMYNHIYKDTVEVTGGVFTNFIYSVTLE